MACVNIVKEIKYVENVPEEIRFKDFLKNPEYRVMYIIVHEDVKDICAGIIRSISEEAIKHIAIDFSESGSRVQVQVFGCIEGNPIELTKFEILAAEPILNLTVVDSMIEFHKGEYPEKRIFLVMNSDTLGILEANRLIYYTNLGKYYNVFTYKIPIAIFEDLNNFGQVEVMYDMV